VEHWIIVIKIHPISFETGEKISGMHICIQFMAEPIVSIHHVSVLFLIPRESSLMYNHAAEVNSADNRLMPGKIHAYFSSNSMDAVHNAFPQRDPRDIKYDSNPHSGLGRLAPCGFCQSPPPA